VDPSMPLVGSPTDVASDTLTEGELLLEVVSWNLPKIVKKIEVRKFNMILYYFLACIFYGHISLLGKKSLVLFLFYAKRAKGIYMQR